MTTRARYETPLAVALKGAVAGLVGTAAITVAMKAAPTVMSQLGIKQPEPQGGEEPEEPTTKLAQKVAEGVFDQSLDKSEGELAGQAIHWSYGAAWGAFYGIMQASLRLPHWLHGTTFGGLIALVASTLVPALGIVPAAKDQPSSQKIMQSAMCMLYGWTTALVFRALSKDA